jgi:hypothetical protein
MSRNNPGQEQEHSIMKTTDPKDSLAPAQLITDQINSMPDWRGTLMARLRVLIHAAAPEIPETWKWESAVWSQKGNVVSICAFKDHVKVNFFKGASLDDPQGLFNAGLEAKATRAIDFFETEDVQETALKQLIRAAVAYNLASGKKE